MLSPLQRVIARRRLDLAVIKTEPNVLALTGVKCDNVAYVVGAAGAVFHTDFRYVPMVHRTAPALKVRDIGKLDIGRAKRIGYESAISVTEFDALKRLNRRAKFIDIACDLEKLRAVKGADEIARMRAAAGLNDRILKKAVAKFRAGMTEREMAAVIRHLMIDLGEGEAFETIVCVGRNAAECHHVPDDTVWNGREPVLVDMGVRLDGYCSDMTRNLVPKRASRLYRKIYDIVLKANLAAIRAARPGITGRALDKVARDIIKAEGFGKCFGHSLGHGVGLEIHEAPYASARSKWTLKPGMVVTIEPGIYLEGNLGVRIEDIVLITDDGCEVLSHSAK